MSLLSEDIGKRLKAQEVASTAQDLARGQERLMDALDKLQSGDKNLDAIMKQLSELAKTLGSLQQALSQMAQQMPDDFMNAESMRSLGFNEMFSALDEIRKKLMAGDIEGARQLARELFNQMASMVASLQNSQRQSMMSSMGRMQGEMQRSNSELQQIAREQQEILLGTEGDQQVGAERARQRAERETRALFGKSPERAGPADRDHFRTGKAATTIPRPPKSSTSNHESAGKESDRQAPGARIFPATARATRWRARSSAKPRTPRRSPKYERAEKTLKNLKSELDALMGEPGQAMNEGDKKTVRDLAQRQSALQERTDELHEKLDSLFQLFPTLDRKFCRTSKKPAAPWVRPRTASANSIRQAPCRLSAARLNGCPSRSSKCNRRCNKWRSAASSAICR